MKPKNFVLPKVIITPYDDTKWEVVDFRPPKVAKGGMSRTTGGDTYIEYKPRYYASFKHYLKLKIRRGYSHALFYPYASENAVKNKHARFIVVPYKKSRAKKK